MTIVQTFVFFSEEMNIINYQVEAHGEKLYTIFVMRHEKSAHRLKPMRANRSTRTCT